MARKAHAKRPRRYPSLVISDPARRFPFSVLTGPAIKRADYSLFARYYTSFVSNCQGDSLLIYCEPQFFSRIPYFLCQKITKNHICRNFPPWFPKGSPQRKIWDTSPFAGYLVSHILYLLIPPCTTFPGYPAGRSSWAAPASRSRWRSLFRRPRGYSA